MNSLIEDLKTGSRYFAITYDVDSNGIVASAPVGAIMTRQEYKDLVEGLTQFFACHNDEEIEQFNLKAIKKYNAALFPATTSMKQESVGSVYLLRTENGLFKIGKAKDLTKRFQPFHVKFPMKWEMIHSFRSNYYSRAETKLLHRFSDKQAVGEWFKLDPDDVTFIQSLQDYSLDGEDN